MQASGISLQTLNEAGRRAYLALFFCEHLLGADRFERVLGATRDANHARMAEFLSRFPAGERRAVSEAPFTSHDDFFRTHLRSTSPVVFRSAASHWPAAGKWDLDFFADHYGDRPCAMVDHAGLSNDAEHGHLQISTVGDLAAAVRRGEKAYLRFSPIVKQIPELRADLDMQWLSGFRSRFSLRGEPQLFVGPASTSTPLHCALECNVFVQLRGKKRWLLYPARYQQLLGPRAERLPYFHSRGRPDVPSPDFPLLEHAPALEVVLDAGDVMYVPPFVWHTVENLTPTVAIGYRYNSLRAAVRSSWPLTVLRFLATRPSLLHTLYYSLTSTNFLYKPSRRDESASVEAARGAGVALPKS